MPKFSISQKIRAFDKHLIDNPHHRYRSWEHCYSYFQRDRPNLTTNRREAALQLGFYLASWGMYRGSGFLLQHTYTVHLPVVDVLSSQTFESLWDPNFGSKTEHSNLSRTVLAAVDAIRAAYEPFGTPTDTLVTKIMLGTFGCLPACDRYFIDGFKSEGFNYSRLNERFVERAIGFCRENLTTLRLEQKRIERRGRIRYPLMKLLDMYCWQIGYERGLNSRAARRRRRV